MFNTTCIILFKYKHCFSGVMGHPLGYYACQPSESSVVAHALTACYYLNGAAYTHGATQNIAKSVAKVFILSVQHIYIHPGYLFFQFNNTIN